MAHESQRDLTPYYHSTRAALSDGTQYLLSVDATRLGGKETLLGCAGVLPPLPPLPSWPGPLHRCGP
eukprot:10020628-Lingulodinium_polyedra.AAC.1